MIGGSLNIPPCPAPPPSNRHLERRAKLRAQPRSSPEEWREAPFPPPTCPPSCKPDKHPESIQPFPIDRLRDYTTRSIYRRAPNVNAVAFKSFRRATHQPGGTKAALSSISTCLALHVPRCFVALCAHLFKGLSLSLSISHSIYFLLPSPRPPLVPTGDLFFLLWDLGCHSLGGALFASYPFQRMGPERRNGRLWVLLSLSLSPPAPRHPAPCSLPYDDVMAPIDSLSLLHTLYISLYLLSCFPPASPFPRFFCFSKGARGVLGMFGCCSAHPPYMP